MGTLVRFFCVFALLQEASSQTGVCQHTVSSLQSYQVYVSVSSGYTYACGLFWLFQCSRTRYRTKSELRTRAIYHNQPICCHGYNGDGVHCNPICTNCHETRVCVAPETCECPVGWTGNQCSEDINECETGICDNCTNTEGSYQCVCPDGSTLPSGQFSCIDSPEVFSVSATSSTSLFINWEAPDTDDMEGELVSFSVSCSGIGDDNPPIVTETTELSVRLYRLQPYTAYTCCAVANTTVGVSGASCTTQTTLEDVPSGPPENVTVAAVSPFAVEIEWSTLITPNGVVLNYSVYSSGSFIASVNSSLMSYLYRGLSPYEQVSISVSASTKIGEGPKSTEKITHTQESAPGVVSNMQVLVVSDNLLNVSWEPPLSPNGVITGYQVAVVNLINSTTFDIDRQYNELEASISNGIEPYVPYSISVRASTSAGTGEARDIVAFTKEGVPLTTPSILSADRTDATSALIQWELLSLKQLRGNLSSYELVYYDLDDECPPISNTRKQESVSVEDIEPVYSISDLDPGQEYCVGLAAKTGAGVGTLSYKPIFWYNNSVFAVVLALVDIQSCSQWINEMLFNKTEDMVQEVSHGIGQYCQCDFTSNYITDNEFLCNEEDPDSVIFQGRIIGTKERESMYLVEELEKWISNEPTIVVQGEKLQVVTPLNPSSDKQQDDNSLPGTAIGLSGALVILLLLIATAVVSTIYCKRRQMRVKSDNMTSNQTDTITVKPSESDDHVLTELRNPYYGYGTHVQENIEEDVGYCEVPKQPEVVKATVNPTYGVTRNERSAENGMVLNPLYTEGVAPQRQSGVSVSSNGLYTEVPVSREVHIYDAPENN